ncbi:MAG: hypothetical protein Q8K98_08850 [Bacteroidota bacterium]|nr:hypothetical protein [Bacteroidota bacterium]
MGCSKNPPVCVPAQAEKNDEYRTRLNDACPTNPFGGQQAGAGKELFTPLDSRRWSELKNKNNIQRGKF